MGKKAAKTARSPMFQIALEQLAPEGQRVIQDEVAYQLLPAPFKGLINICRIDFFRRNLLKLVDIQAPGIHGGILCRKRFVEDNLKTALEAGIGTVVILGAGFDTLAYRIAELASMQVFEVDLPQIIRTKKRDLQRTFGQVPPYVKLVSMDFDSQELGVVLRQADYSDATPAFFVWEGVTQYIPENSIRRVFEFFRQASTGSQLVFTYICKDFIEGKQMYGLNFVYNQAIKKAEAVAIWV